MFVGTLQKKSSGLFHETHEPLLSLALKNASTWDLVVPWKMSNKICRNGM